MTRNELLKIRGINNKFQFGKYKGKTLLYVLDNNPQYNNWKVQRERKHIFNQMKQYNLTASDYLSLLEAQEI